MSRDGDGYLHFHLEHFSSMSCQLSRELLAVAFCVEGVLQVVYGTSGIYPLQAFRALIYVSADTIDCQPVSHIICERRNSGSCNEVYASERSKSSSSRLLLPVC